MKLKTYFKQFKGYGIAAMLCITLESLFELAIPMIMADIINIGIIENNTVLIYQRGAMMIGCALIALVLGYFCSFFTSRFAYSLGHQLRVDAFKVIQDYSFQNLDNFSNASLITRLTSDINVIQASIMNGMRPLCRAPMMLIMSVVFSFVLNPQLSLIFMVAAPVLGLILIVLVRNISPRFKQLQQSIDQVNQIVQENVSGIRVVKAFVREDYEQLKFEQVNQDVKNIGINTFKVATLNAPSFQLVMYTTIIVLLYMGGNLVFHDTIQIGTLTGVLSYVLQVLNALMMLSHVFLMITRSLTSTVRVKELFDETIDLPDNPKGLSKLQDGSVIFDHVGFSYFEASEQAVLKDVSLAISSGTMVGIMGTTGSSKSTLVQLMLRLYDVSEGRIIIGQADVKDYQLASLRDEIAIVLQKNTLFSGTIIENLRWGNQEATLEEVEEACRIAQCHDFIMEKKNGYDSKVEQGGSNFSGGQRQRLCIARALLKKSKILILDDSTSALDRATEKKIWDALKVSYPSMTKIIIAQRVTSVMDTDQIIILDQGQIHAAGNHEALLELDPLYRDIFLSQQEGVLA